ncbi:MAG TPA: hypothetical protein EYM36_04140 [Acidobacteria bacterium]|nr:hypothetical protein [Acidobacteriota bacterium]
MRCGPAPSGARCRHPRAGARAGRPAAWHRRGGKIGSRLFTSEGPSLISTLTHRGDRVFLDLKYHDIPTVAAEAVRAAARLGTWMLTVHSSCPRTRSRPPRPS